MFTQPDLGTALVIVFTIGTMLVAAGIPMAKLGKIAASLAGLIVLYALVRPYARARLTSFLDPWAHASGSGFQAVQGQIAIGSGGLFGVGPGQSVQKIFYLPEAPTDFILAVIAEELGMVGVWALLFLYGLIAYAGPARGEGGAQPLQRPDRRRRDGADPLPGDPQRVRRAGARAADRRAAAVRLLRVEQPDRDAGRDGPAAERGRRGHRPRAGGRHAPRGRRALLRKGRMGP